MRHGCPFEGGHGTSRPNEDNIPRMTDSEYPSLRSPQSGSFGIYLPNGDSEECSGAPPMGFGLQAIDWRST